MADQSIQYTEEMVGAGHPTKADTLNRLALKYLNNDGTPIVANTSVTVNVGNASGDPSHDIAFIPGSCFDETLTEPMVLSASPFVKQIDAPWAVGNEAGGLDTGTVAASTLYALWLIKRTDTGVVDALFSTSFTAPTMPTNSDKQRLIGAVRTDSSSNLLAFTQSGDYFRYDVPQQEVNDSTITSETAEAATISVPPNCLAHLYASMSNATGTLPGNGRILVRTKDANDALSVGSQSISEAQVADIKNVGGMGLVLTDGSRQIEYMAGVDNGAAIVFITVIGFFMLTRSNP